MSISLLSFPSSKFQHPFISAPCSQSTFNTSPTDVIRTKTEPPLKVYNRQPHQPSIVTPLMSSLFVDLPTFNLDHTIALHKGKCFIPTHPISRYLAYDCLLSTYHAFFLGNYALSLVETCNG